MTSNRSQPSLESSQIHQQINAHLGRVRKPKGDRTRRSWTEKEEEALVIHLKELVVRGWKSDNGFRSGFLKKLEDAMRIQFPNSDIKGTPHIMSKISAWKKSYGLLANILNRSGMGFNSKGDYKFECDDDQWDQIVKAEPDARFMRGKSWPFWEYWQVIFGKDRASGTFSEDLMESVNELHSLEHMQESIGTGGSDFNLGDQPTPEPFDGTQTPPAAADSTGHSNPTKATSSSGGKKRKIDLGIDGLVQMLEKVHDDTNMRLDTLSQRIGYEFDLSKARKHVYEQLGKLPGLSRDQKFDVGGWILEKVERLDFFLGMPDEDRLAYVSRALEKYL